MILICALLSAAIHLGVAVFQIFLATGKPWGEYAFGGQNKGVLPRHLRTASIFSCVLVTFFAAVNLAQAGLIQITGFESLFRIAGWVIAGYAVLGTFMNAISRSKPERLLWTPIVALLAVLNITILVLTAK
ncbi:hypothetical protein [Turneriella parva]|uniref:Integral membrane protein n=1 Tax=Turneriella parva (strain ATCC BAA-1111 / DSM 21527 / NCTC 11395 / H) TaxID=869212 RepID=I4B4V6_TURPD|nr:hypothetical protein [Turneriella parva]AFM12313.1 putative integral membrane protein [Turneriella parva DSM 21527]